MTDELRFARPFSNGEEYRNWTARNCDRCALNGYRFGIAPCEFEENLSIGTITGKVSVDIATHYGATEDEDGPDYIKMPTQCGKFRFTSDDDTQPPPAPPEPDPRHLVLLADPTEDAATIQTATPPREAPITQRRFARPTPGERRA